MLSMPFDAGLLALPYLFSVVGTSRCYVRAACSGATASNAGIARTCVPPATTRAGTAQRAVPTIALTVLYRSKDRQMSRVFINRSQLVGLRRGFVVQILRSSAQLPNAGQLLVQAFGGNGEGGPEFLGKDRDFELFDQPPKFLCGLTGFRGTRGSGLKLIQGFLVWGDLTGAFLIFGWIQRGALDSRKQCPEVARKVRQAIPETAVKLN